jgi:hypothetical protein
VKNKVLKVILVFSLLLNASMLGSAGYIHYRQSRYHAFRLGNVQRSGDTVPSCLFEELSLKPGQQRVMQQKALAFHADMERKRQEVDGKRTYLLGLMRADNPDGKTLDAAIAEINRLQEGIQKMAVAHMLEFKGMLDKDQQIKFLDLLEGAMAKKTGLQCP